MIERARIVAALGSVAELTPSPTQPPAMLSGAAWPVWDHAEGVNRCVFRDVWTVVVACPPGDRASAIEYSDALREPIGLALFGVPAFVDRIEPSQLSPEEGGQAVPVLLFTISH